MKRTVFIYILLTFTACKKESTDIQHTVQFSSNINDPNYYSLTINNENNRDINTIYTLEKDSNIELKLFSAGGDTASVDAGDSLWARGGIIVDGKLVSSFSGYRNATLTYHIE